ncbi:MAG: YybH family protein, partial [Thermoplasmata archaeon]
MSAEEEIKAANGRFMEATRNADAAALSAHYTRDGQVLPPNGEMVSGREALTTFWQSVLDTGIRDHRLESLEVIPMGDLAVEVGTYSLRDEDGAFLDRGNLMVVWKEEDGVWRMHRDIWNSSLPLP